MFSQRNNTKIELPLVEHMWIEIKTNRRPVVAEVVYRHPTNSTCDCKKFSENFFKIFYELNFKKFPFYILGDFNIDLNKVGKSNFVSKYVHNTISSPCKCIIVLLTRITDHCKTFIDHTYVNDPKHSYISGVVLSELSDHFGTLVIMIAKATKSHKTKRYQIQDRSKFDHEKFLQNLANELTTIASNNNESVHNQFEEIFKIFSNNVNTSAPFKSAFRRDKRLIAKPWLSRGLVNSITRKNRLFIKLQKCFNFAAFNDCKKYLNSLNRLIKTAKQNFCNKAIEVNKNNQDQI